MSVRRIAYLVSGFPVASETFVVRELDEVEADPRLEVELLLSLFAPRRRFSHAISERWLPRHRRPSHLAAAGATVAWLLRRPLRMLGALAAIGTGAWRRPGALIRALAVVPLAAAHATTVRRAGIDHVHAHFAASPALAAWLIARLTGASYSFTAHAYDIFIDQTLLARKIAEASFVVTISDYNRRFLAPYDPGSRVPVHVIHCGVDPDAYPFEPKPPAAGAARALCVATLQVKKGHAVLLRALAGNPDLGDLELALAGGGELDGELRDLAAELGIADRVDFLGPQEEAQVRALLRDCDIFVLPSIIAPDGQMEGIPVALMEAIAVGRPVVASRMSGIPELVRDQRIGRLAEPGDVVGLGEAIAAVRSGAGLDPAAGRALIETEFDIRESGRRMAALLAGARPQRK